MVGLGGIPVLSESEFELGDQTVQVLFLEAVLLTRSKFPRIQQSSLRQLIFLILFLKPFAVQINCIVRSPPHPNETFKPPITTSPHQPPAPEAVKEGKEMTNKS